MSVQEIAAFLSKIGGVPPHQVFEAIPSLTDFMTVRTPPEDPLKQLSMSCWQAQKFFETLSSEEEKPIHRQVRAYMGN